MRYVFGLFALVYCALAVVSASSAEARRVALVIGNADYKVGPLQNPVRDASAVADAFGKLGFDKVILKRNLGAEGFRAALREIAREARGAELGAIYFAGHGTEVGGRNFLIPVDATLATAGDLDLEAIGLDTVLNQLAGVTKLKLVILDACRNNLFPVAGGKRNVSRGLSRLEPEDNSLVVYAAKDGTTADDGVGRRHSPFTEALLKHIATPGVEVRLMLGRVRDDVMATTSPVQQPHVYASLGGREFYLHSPKAPPPAPVVRPQVSEAERAWAAVKDSTSVAELEVIATRYKGTVYGDLAQARINELKKQVALVAPPPKAVPSAPTPSSPYKVLNAPPKIDPAVTARAAKPLTPAEQRALRPKDSFRECDACPEMVVVPAGEFVMGATPAEIATSVAEVRSDWPKNQGPQHGVTIRQAFAVGKFEVTFTEWDTCAAVGGCVSNPRPDDKGWGRGRHPVINVSWHDAKEYVAWLSRKTGKPYRLLTEAEWEYAARGVTSALAPGRYYWWGDQPSREFANYGSDACCSGFALGRDQWTYTAPVGQFPANPFGLHDMHGNVWEWCEDNWHPNYEGAPVDGSVWLGGEISRRVYRGGDWHHFPAVIRSAYRGGNDANYRSSGIGFRVARTLD